MANECRCRSCLTAEINELVRERAARAPGRGGSGIVAPAQRICTEIHVRTEGAIDGRPRLDCE